MMKKSVRLGDNLQTIGDAAFLGHGMKEILLPASLKEIGVSALYPAKPASPLTVTVSGNITNTFCYALLDFTVTGKILWPQKLTVKLSRDASGEAETIRAFMAEDGISKKEWKPVCKK